MLPWWFFEIFLDSYTFHKTSQSRLLKLLSYESYASFSFIDTFFFTWMPLSERSSRSILKKRFLKIFSKFTGENQCRSVISIKLLCNFIEITLRHRRSPKNYLHIFRTLFLKNTSRRLLLDYIIELPKIEVIAVKL